MKRTLMIAALTALACTIPATPAAAQSVVSIGKATGCPGGYRRGSATNNNRSQTNPELCYYSKSSNPPTIAMKSRTSGPCPDGLTSESSTSLWCTSRVSGGVPAETVSGKIAKSDPLDRCPATFYSEPDLKTCISIASSPPPTRAKGAGACRAGELEEWGKWCTTNNGKMVEGDVTQGHYRDVNTIYQFSGSKTPNGGADIYNTPTIRALFRGGAGGGAGASAQPASSNSQSASNDAPDANTNCGNGSSSGATLGGALGGDAGAALGSMLGGFGKKKKKAGC